MYKRKFNSKTQRPVLAYQSKSEGTGIQILLDSRSIVVSFRGRVEDTRLEAKDTKKSPRPRPRTALPKTDTLEAKANDQGHKCLCSPKKQKGLHKNFLGDLQIKKKKVFTKYFQTISTKKRFPKNFSSASRNFNNSKNTAVLEPRTGQFSRTRPRT